jgi:hypothetical protein
MIGCLSMRIDVSVGAGTREQVAEQAIAPERRRAGHDRNEPRRKLPACDFHHPANAADRGRAVEGGAHLVVDDRRADGGERLEHRRQAHLHFSRAHAPAVPGHARRIERGELRQRFRLRRLEEQGAAQPGEGQHLQRIGRAGEIVAVEDQPAFSPGAHA